MNNQLKELYKECEQKHLVNLLEEYEYEFKEYINQHPLNLVLQEFQDRFEGIPLNLLIKNPSGLLQVSLLTNAIYLKLLEIPDSDKVFIFRRAFKDSLANLVKKVVDASKPQLELLCEFLNKIAGLEVIKFATNLYILELPLGNSIPSLLIQKILAMKGIDSKIINISLNRNDSRKKGITRKELLEEKIKSLDLGNSLVIYIDEWITGSNFNNIITHLSKIPELHIIPAAIMDLHSKDNKRYKSYEKTHSKITSAMGLESEQLICHMPQLNKDFDGVQKFIWAEVDRVAGYRKIELFGSIVSTFNYVGKLLQRDHILFEETIKSNVSENSELKDLMNIPLDFKTNMWASLEYYNTIFSKKIENKLGKETRAHELPINYESEFNKFLSSIKNIDGHEKAIPALNLMNYYMIKSVISPTDRYYFQGFAPLCLKLKGEEFNLHKLFMASLSKFCGLEL